MEPKSWSELVESELERQEEKFGERCYPPHVWLTLLMEEVGETATAVLEMTGGPTPDSEEVAAVRDEAVQVAAAAVRLLGWCDDPAQRVYFSEDVAVPARKSERRRFWRLRS